VVVALVVSSVSWISNAKNMAFPPKLPRSNTIPTAPLAWPSILCGWRKAIHHCPLDLKVGDTVMSGPTAEIRLAILFRSAISRSVRLIHNIEMKKARVDRLVRSAGGAAQLLAKEGDFAQIRMPSGEVRLIHQVCYATIGQVGNLDHGNVKLGKAGRKRHLGIRPTVRGTAMSPRDHPHGGGEGRQPIGLARSEEPVG
jgi:large subunit ribosomal protein L2